MQRMYQPGLPVGGVVQAAPTVSEAGQYVQPQVGTLTGNVAVPTATAGVHKLLPCRAKAASTIEAAQAAPAVGAALDSYTGSTRYCRPTCAGHSSPANGIQCRQSSELHKVMLFSLTILCKGRFRTVNLSPALLQMHRLLHNFTEQIQAAEATPSTQATVQGQLASAYC